MDLSGGGADDSLAVMGSLALWDESYSPEGIRSSPTQSIATLESCGENKIAEVP
jgi:hypothetical protein